MSDTLPRTELSSLGEFGLIERIASRIQLTQASSVKGIGDDAAVIDPKGLHQVVTTDMLVEGVHFDLGYVPLKHLGYKAIVVNLSDVYAMNAEPRQVTVALALSNRFPVEAVDELYEGMLRRAHITAWIWSVAIRAAAPAGSSSASRPSVRPGRRTSCTAVVPGTTTCWW